MTIDIERLKTTVKSVANNTARSFQGYAESSDLESELWIWLLENKETVRRYDTEEDGDRKIGLTLKREAMKYAQGLKAAKLGYSPDDLVGYGVAQLKVLLEDVFEYDNWESSQVDYSGTPKSKRIEPTGDRVTSLCDVKAGLEKLDERNYNIIVGVWKYGYDDQAVADMLEISINSVPTTINRAVRALSKLLSGPGEPVEPDRRNVQSNAASRAALSHHYEG